MYKNINPASVKRLTEAIDVWLKNIPKMMPELKPNISRKEIKEIQGRVPSIPKPTGETSEMFHEATMGTKKPKPMQTDIDIVLKKVKTYRAKIAIFMDEDERNKKRVMRNFFDTGKIDELEDIASGEYKITGTKLIQGKNDKHPKYTAVGASHDFRKLLIEFNSFRRELNSKRPEGTIVEQLDAAYKKQWKVARLPKGQRKEKKDFFDSIGRSLPKEKVKRTTTHSMGPRKEYIARRMKEINKDLDEKWLKGLKGKGRENRREKLLEDNKEAIDNFKESIGELWDAESKRINQKGSVKEMADIAERNRRKEERERKEKQASEDFMRRLSAGETWTSEGFEEEG